MNRAVVIGFLTLLLAHLSSCSKKNENSRACSNPISSQIESCIKPTQISGWIMEMPYHILVGDPLSDAEQKDLTACVLSIFSDIHTTFNKFNADSELSKLNQLKAYEKMPISQPLAEMMLFCKKIHLLSEGRFDPTIEKAMDLWKTSLEKGSLLEKDKLEKARSFIGFDKVHIEKGIFYKTSTDLSIDLGGVAKGHAVDLIAEKLKEKGVKSALINWSGELYAFGKHPEQRAWQVMIPAYVKKGFKLPLENRALATSGDYLQNWRVTVKDRIMTLCHILDPRSARPIEIKHGSMASVTVAAKSCMLADALATSAMLFEDQEKLNLWVQKVKSYYPDVSFWTLQRQGSAL